MKPLFKIQVKFFLFVLCCTLWSGLFFVIPDFIDNADVGIFGSFIKAGYLILVCIATFILLYITAINKYLFAVFLPLFATVGTLVSYYRYAYKATLTPAIIDAALHNDIGTSLDVLSPFLFIYLAINILIAILAIKYRWKKISVPHPIVHFSIAIILFVLFFKIDNRITVNVAQHFPYNVYFNIELYNELHEDIATNRINPDTTAVVAPCNDTLIVAFVLGESLRADHLSLNGYNRETTPLLSKQRNLISFPNIYSEYTLTNRSLPHILTRADSANVQRAFEETSFVPQFTKNGFNSAWISNQDPADTYISFIRECDTTVYAHPEKTVYVLSNWLDEDLLPITEQFIKGNKTRQLLILHTIGSHWYYNNHVSQPFEKYKPTTTNRVVALNEPENIINSYDNTVFYTDYFLNRLITSLDNKRAIIIFLSDHGEALGENGEWLHANDNPAIKRPACLVWCSDCYIQSYPDKWDALQLNKQKRYRTDFLFHSILSAANISTPILDNSLNIFYDCSKTE